MGVLSYLWNITRLRTTSPFNHDIRVIEINGKNRLYVNGILQTGPYDKAIFMQAFDHFGISKQKTNHQVLVLGLGGGFVVKQLAEWNPSARFVCVDIDERMVEIAQEYFGLRDIPQVTYIVEDAKAFVSKTSSPDHHFDLIVTDLYIGDEVADFISSPDFLQGIASLVGADGRVLINYQGERGNEQNIKMIVSGLRSLFDITEQKNIYRNTFLFAHKKRVS